MTGNKVLLDTNIIIALPKGELTIAVHIDSADDIYIPVIVIGELYFGAFCSTQIEKGILEIQGIISDYKLLQVDEGTTPTYGKIKAELRKKGKPIPENNIWIAAIANQHNLTVVTRDKHFNEIDGLEVTHW